MGILETQLAGYGAGALGVFVVIMTLAYAGLKVLYNVYFHPLSDYPGPWLAASSRLWYAWHCTRGNVVYVVQAAHEKYGEVVRIAPDELSYIDPKAWNEIYGHRIGKEELMKDPTFYSSLAAGPLSMISANRVRHGLLRKQASHGFSEAALRSQEAVIKEHADLFVSRLKESAEKQEDTVDIVSWFNFFTFDVMGVLVFGESFDCLTNWGYHPWVSVLFDAVRMATWTRCSKYWPSIAPYLRKFILPEEIKQRAARQRELTLKKAAYRKSITDGRQDLISGFLKPDSGVTHQEYQASVQSFIIAGSETTATLMSGLIFYLLKDPDRLTKLTTEIRTTFSSDDEVTFVNISKLPFLMACLNEALRIYPPVADTFPRNTGPHSEVICGKVVPPWTKIGVNHWSTYHSTRNFAQPDDFIPERWMEDSKLFPNDRKEALQPFHVGPRNCIGRNLAYFEMRLLIVSFLLHFDIELDQRSERWNQQKVFTLWEKPPMYVKLRPVASRS